ncbi:MAG: hypothetical protein WCG93_16395 [Paludibacter sp.]
MESTVLQQDAILLNVNPVNAIDKVYSKFWNHLSAIGVVQIC